MRLEAPLNSVNTYNNPLTMRLREQLLWTHGTIFTQTAESIHPCGFAEKSRSLHPQPNGRFPVGANQTALGKRACGSPKTVR
ncbi:MAG: hypothetical protein QOJ45_1514 [Verrucomicrobiota bacterium]|jgi:hypothetical protein